MVETVTLILGQQDPLENELATHSSTLAWKIPWTEEPGRLRSMESDMTEHTQVLIYIILLVGILLASFKNSLNGCLSYSSWNQLKGQMGRGSQKIQWKIMLYSKLECRSLVITQAPQFFLIWCDANFVHMFCITRREYFVSLEESFPGGTEVKNPLANAGDIRDMSLIPGSERSPGEGHGNPLQYSCLEDPMDRGGWWATVHGVAT